MILHSLRTFLQKNRYLNTHLQTIQKISIQLVLEISFKKIIFLNQVRSTLCTDLKSVQKD